jgi:hypothetical protein
MGAAGYVAVFNEADVRARYKELWPDNDIDDDWWYLKTCSADIQGTRYIFDYADDQGTHEGSREPFWFRHRDGEDFLSESEAQKRVLAALYGVGAVATAEVWT